MTNEEYKQLREDVDLIGSQTVLALTILKAHQQLLEKLITLEQTKPKSIKPKNNLVLPNMKLDGTG